MKKLSTASRIAIEEFLREDAPPERVISQWAWIDGGHMVAVLYSVRCDERACTWMTDAVVHVAQSRHVETCDTYDVPELIGPQNLTCFMCRAGDLLGHHREGGGEVAEERQDAKHIWLLADPAPFSAKQSPAIQYARQAKEEVNQQTRCRAALTSRIACQQDLGLRLPCIA